MRAAALTLLVAVLAGCTRIAPPIEAIARFDGELGAAKQKRRVLALASPS